MEQCCCFSTTCTRTGRMGRLFLFCWRFCWVLWRKKVVMFLMTLGRLLRVLTNHVGFPDMQVWSHDFNWFHIDSQRHSLQFRTSNPQGLRSDIYILFHSRLLFSCLLFLVEKKTNGDSKMFSRKFQCSFQREQSWGRKPRRLQKLNKNPPKPWMKSRNSWKI